MKLFGVMTYDINHIKEDKWKSLIVMVCILGKEEAESTKKRLRSLNPLSVASYLSVSIED